MTKQVNEELNTLIYRIRLVIDLYKGSDTAKLWRISDILKEVQNDKTS